MSSAHSDRCRHLVLTLGLAALALSALLVVQLVVMRLQGQRRERERQAVIARWQPLLTQAAQGQAERLTLPPLAAHELAELLLLWNLRQEAVHGGAHAALNRLAERLGLRAQATALLQRRDPADRLLGVATLGHLGRAEDAPLLAKLLADPHTLLSLGAARALLQIDAAAAVPIVVERYLGRGDWPAARLGALLRGAGATAVAPVLAAQLLPPPSAPRPACACCHCCVPRRFQTSAACWPHWWRAAAMRSCCRWRCASCTTGRRCRGCASWAAMPTRWCARRRRWRSAASAARPTARRSWP